MSSVARKTLWREWPRFFPAIMATAFAGVLLLTQTGLVLGIFGSASVHITQSDSDLWVGYPDTQSVNLGHAVSNDLLFWLHAQPEIRQAEPMLWLDADWRSPRASASISVTGLNPQPDGLLFNHLLLPAIRTQLQEPGAVIVDRSDLDTLGVQAGDLAWINQHPVHIVALVRGLRSLGGVNILASLETTRWLSQDASSFHTSTYFIATLKNPQTLPLVLQRLNQPLPGFGPHQAWSAPHFARQSQMFWLFDTGAGMAVFFLAVVVFVVCAVITSQSLMAVVISSSREYATLNALGAGLTALRWMVFEQSLWVGGLGLLCSLVFALILWGVARWHDVPAQMTLPAGLACAALVFLLSLVSGLFAMRGLLRADPALLLR